MFEADRLEFVREDNQISVQISSSGYRREQLELIQEYCPVEIVQKTEFFLCSIRFLSILKLLKKKF